MTTTTKITVGAILLFCFSSCFVFKKHKSMISQKEDFVWVGKTTENVYSFEIESSDDRWFEGILIQNQSDTVFIKGFEKGNNHPCHIVHNQLVPDSTYANAIFIWSKGMKSDTIEINQQIREKDVDNGIPTRLLLTKVAKTN